jgi:predicted amidophosphoribosyltransferase
LPSDEWAAARARVAQQSNYLRNPLPPGPGVCSVCRGPVEAAYRRCWVCNQHISIPGSLLADAVVPVAYGIKGEQHYQNLVAYKAKHPAAVAQTRLRDLALVFLREHWRCLSAAAGGPVSRLAIVPSTSGRVGPHPLARLIAPRIPLALVEAAPNAAYPAIDRTFHADRFRVRHDASQPLDRVLLLDDTWTTGARVQSMAHALKAAGATSVIAVVLGRLVKSEYEPSRQLLGRVSRNPFDIGQCCLRSCRNQGR